MPFRRTKTIKCYYLCVQYSHQFFDFFTEIYRTSMWIMKINLKQTWIPVLGTYEFKDVVFFFISIDSFLYKPKKIIWLFNGITLSSLLLQLLSLLLVAFLSFSLLMKTYLKLIQPFRNFNTLFLRAWQRALQFLEVFVPPLLEIRAKRGKIGVIVQIDGKKLIVELIFMIQLSICSF